MKPYYQKEEQGYLGWTEKMLGCCLAYQLQVQRHWSLAPENSVKTRIPTKPAICPGDWPTIDAQRATA